MSVQNVVQRSFAPVPAGDYHYTMLRPVVAAFLVATLTGCADSVESLTTTWEADLAAGGPGGFTGQVGVLSQGDRSVVAIALVGADADSTYAWDLRHGGCTERGEILAGAAVYPQLEPGPGGDASAETTISERLASDGYYSARVRYAGSTADLVCAVLERTN